MKKGNNIAVDPKRPDGAAAMSWLALQAALCPKGSTYILSRELKMNDYGTCIEKNCEKDGLYYRADVHTDPS